MIFLKVLFKSSQKIKARYLRKSHSSTQTNWLSNNNHIDQVFRSCRTFSFLIVSKQKLSASPRTTTPKPNHFKHKHSVHTLTQQTISVINQLANIICILTLFGTILCELAHMKANVSDEINKLSADPITNQLGVVERLCFTVSLANRNHESRKFSFLFLNSTLMNSGW